MRIAMAGILRVYVAIKTTDNISLKKNRSVEIIVFFFFFNFNDAQNGAKYKEASYKTRNDCS